MSIIETAMIRSRTVIMTLAVILIAGVVTYVSVPKEAEPDMQIPIVYISHAMEEIMRLAETMVLISDGRDVMNGIAGYQRAPACVMQPAQAPQRQLYGGR